MSRFRCVTLAVVVAVLATPTAAQADPVVPQPDTPCPANLANAMTRLPDQKIVVCRQEANGLHQWGVVAPDYPSSDRWLTYGPSLILHGEGTRNHNLRSGDWVAVPQDPDSQCVAEQVAVAGAGVVSSPEVESGATGQQLSFRVVPDLFSITMTGYCLWSKVNAIP
jgi:hypothetical protein